MMRLGTAKLVILAHLGNAVVAAFFVRYFVERSKSCLDFSLTHYFIHFILVWHYSEGIPDTFIWYFINVASICIMCIVSEFLCRKEEMKLIPVSASI